MSKIYKDNKTSDWIEVKQKIKKVVTSSSSVTSSTTTSYVKTEMCKQGTQCNRGKRCTYAHSTKDFNIRDCPYEKGCKLIKLSQDNQYINKPNNYYHNNKTPANKCRRRHPGETDANFFVRTGIKDFVTTDEINSTYEEYVKNSKIFFSSEYKEQIEKLPCNKSINFNGILFFGKASPEILVKNNFNNNFNKQQQYKRNNKFQPYRNKQNDVKKTYVSSKKVVFVEEDPEKIYIKNKNLKIDEIRSLKVSITRSENAIARLNKDRKMTLKFEKELKDKNIKLSSLEKELSELKVEKVQKKTIEVCESETTETKVVVDEIKKDNKPKEDKPFLLCIIKNENKVTIESESSSSDDDSSDDEKVIQPVVPVVVQPKIQPSIVENEIGWKTIEKKKHNNNSNKIPQNTSSSSLLKTQICKSILMKSICPHRIKCRYAHNINEMNFNDCGFGSACKLVSKDTRRNEYRNSKEKICSHRHPDETKNNLIKRIKNLF